jgi:hypothetical protein
VESGAVGLRVADGGRRAAGGALGTVAAAGGAIAGMDRGGRDDMMDRDATDGTRPTTGAPPAPEVPAAAAPADRFPEQAVGERPPIPAPFDDGRWEGFVIGEDRDEVMQAPQIAAPASDDDPPPPMLGSEQP